jgi:hypothetical protein
VAGSCIWTCLSSPRSFISLQARVWHLSGGQRVVGRLSRLQQELLPLGRSGFDVSGALAETEGSLGLAGIIHSSDAAASGRSRGDTAGGLVSALVFGDAGGDDEDEEDGGGPGGTGRENGGEEEAWAVLRERDEGAFDDVAVAAAPQGAGDEVKQREREAADAEALVRQLLRGGGAAVAEELYAAAAASPTASSAAASAAAPRLEDLSETELQKLMDAVDAAVKRLESSSANAAAPAAIPVVLSDIAADRPLVPVGATAAPAQLVGHVSTVDAHSLTSRPLSFSGDLSRMGVHDEPFPRKKPVKAPARNGIASASAVASASADAADQTQASVATNSTPLALVAGALEADASAPNAAPSQPFTPQATPQAEGSSGPKIKLVLKGATVATSSSGANASTLSAVTASAAVAPPEPVSSIKLRIIRKQPQGEAPAAASAAPAPGSLTARPASAKLKVFYPAYLGTSTEGSGGAAAVAAGSTATRGSTRSRRPQPSAKRARMDGDESDDGSDGDDSDFEGGENRSFQRNSRVVSCSRGVSRGFLSFVADGDDGDDDDDDFDEADANEDALAAAEADEEAKNEDKK